MDAPELDDEQFADEAESVERLYRALEQRQPRKTLAIRERNATRRADLVSASAWELAVEMDLYPRSFPAVKRTVKAAIAKYWGETR